ncbi:hypothetical protein BASA81_004421 [Batrachochytrium salamandrivorans]|nr:hypothetical protein BASA81_004421 [Batrachochytrium salamandrivorans]
MTEALHPDVAAYMAHRKSRKAGKPVKFRTFVAASLNSPAGMSDFDFSSTAVMTTSSSPVPPPSGVANPSSFAASEPSILAPNTLVQGEWVDDLEQLHNHARLNLGVQVAELDSLTEQEDRRSMDIKVQQEDTKKAFHSTRNHAVEAAGAGGQTASAWGKVDKEAVRIAKEEEEKRREATRPVHLGQDFIPAQTHAGSKPGYDFMTGALGLGYYWNPQPEEKPFSFAVQQDEPKKRAWGNADALPTTTTTAGTGYLRQGGPKIGDTEAPKPAVWRPSNRSEPVTAPTRDTPVAVASGPPRVSAGAAFASRLAATPAASTPAVGEDGRDSLGLKRSSNAMQALRQSHKRFMSVSSPSPVYKTVLSSNFTYVTAIVLSTAVLSGVYGKTIDFYWQQINRGRLYHQIDWTKWQSLYVAEAEDEE